MMSANWAAYVNAFATVALSVNVPFWETLTGKILHWRQAPVTPMPLLPRAGCSSTVGVIPGGIGVVVVVLEIPPAYVIDLPVGIIVNAIAGDFEGIDEDGRRQIFVCLLDSVIEHRNDDASIAVFDVPRLLELCVGSDNAAILARVLQVPLV